MPAPPFPALLRRAIHALPYLALTAAALLVVRLALQVRDLRQAVADLRRDAVLPHAGLVVPTFTASTLAGQQATVGRAPGGGRQVFFVFNTTCGFCRETIPRWNALAERLRSAGSRVAVYGISSDPDSVTRPYVLETGIEFPVVTFPDEKLVAPLSRPGGPGHARPGQHGHGPLCTSRVLYARVGEFETRPDIADSILAAVRVPRVGPDTVSTPPAAAPAGVSIHTNRQGRKP